MTTATTDLALDRRRRPGASAFIRARKAENTYARQLRRMARTIGDLIAGLYDPEHPDSLDAITRAMANYARAATPWAESVARRMIADVAARDRKAWQETARTMGRLLRTEIDTAPTGRLLQARLADQVRLITSLPEDAAKRVHQLTLSGISEGRRPEAIAREIMRSGEVSASRATLIARTEVARTGAELTQARAQHIGSVEYIWRTVGDAQVRPSHRALNGKTFRWDDPPECDPGHRANPGCIWSCRCFAEPIIP